MNLDTDRLKRFAPFAVPLVIAAVGWMFLIAPTASRNAGAGRALDSLQQRLLQVRLAVDAPPPPPVSTDARASFERRVPARDTSYQVFQQLASLAKAQGATALEIETGGRVTMGTPGGPQVADGGAQPDPRFALFEAPMAYSPIAISFDADFAAVGQFLWALRDMSTTVEIRTVDITPASGGRVHVGLTLFAYARENGAAATVGVVQ